MGAVVMYLSKISFVPAAFLLFLIYFFVKTFLQSSSFVSFKNVSISTSESQFHLFMLSLFSVTSFIISF